MLREGAHEFVAHAESFKSRMEGSHVDVRGAQLREPGRSGNTPRTLVGHVELAALVRKVEHQRQFRSLDIDGTRPAPFGKLGPAQTAREEQQQSGKDYLFHNSHLAPKDSE